MNQETKAQRETTVCQVPGDHPGHLERLGEMVPEVTLVTLDQEENLDWLGQKETLEDLASAILGQEDHRVREESRAIVALVAAGETVVKRVSRETRELQESRVSQDLRVNLA